jgi:hypothetical protein
VQVRVPVVERVRDLTEVEIAYYGLSKSTIEIRPTKRLPKDSQPSEGLLKKPFSMHQR